MKDIGKYRLVAEIGRGGMADVYLALAPGPDGFNKMVVIKELREGGQDETTLAMFLDEARIAARLNHPNIAQIYEVGYDGPGQPFLALEFVDGQSLHAVLRRGKRDVPRPLLLRAVSDVLSALDYAHTLADFDGAPLDIVHRDVSPHNVIVSYDGFGKLVDFGIAKATLRNVVTQAGTLKGKLSYMSPEQAGGRPVDARSDLFSVGVMLYQAVTGRRFWGPAQDMNILVRLAGGRLPDISEALAELPAALAAIVRKALAPNPDDRYESAAEFQAELERYGQTERGLASRREVGAYVASLFAPERAALREMLDQRARESRERSETSLLPRLPMASASSFSNDNWGLAPKSTPTASLVPAAPPPPPIESLMPAAPPFATAESFVPAAPPPPPHPPSDSLEPEALPPAAPRARPGLLRQAASVAALLGLGFSASYVVRDGRAAKGEANGAPDVAPAAACNDPATGAARAPGALAAAAVAAVTAIAPAAAKASVSLTIEAQPPRARLSLNGRPLATNPATVTVKADTEQLVRAEAAGFASSSQSVTPVRDESLVLRLQRATRGRPAPPARR